MRFSTGFSLIELSLLVFLMALLASFTLPSLSRLQVQLTADLMRKELMQTVEEASLLASLYHIPVTICPSSNGKECEGDWQSGLLTFFGDGTHASLSSLTIHRYAKWGGRGVSVKWEGFPANLKVITFKPEGLGWNNNGRFIFYDQQQRAQWAVILNRLGRIRSEKLTY